MPRRRPPRTPGRRLARRSSVSCPFRQHARHCVSGDQVRRAAAVSSAEDKFRQTRDAVEVSTELGAPVDTPTQSSRRSSTRPTRFLTSTRVAIQLMDESGALVTKIARDRRGGDQPRAVPQSIARTAVADKVAIIANDAGGDRGSEPIHPDAAGTLGICSPLMGKREPRAGCDLRDNVSAAHKFDEEDLDFVVAFGYRRGRHRETSSSRTGIRREYARAQQLRALFHRRSSRSESPARRAPLASEATTDHHRPVLRHRGSPRCRRRCRRARWLHRLTDYFTEMVECVFNNEGTLDNSSATR